MGTRVLFHGIPVYGEDVDFPIPADLLTACKMQNGTRGCCHHDGAAAMETDRLAVARSFI